MNYGDLLSRAWRIVWEHKFLILLGIIVALSSSGSGNATSTSSRSLVGQEQSWEIPPEWEEQPFEDMRDTGLPLVAVVMIIAVGLVALVIGLAVWVFSTLARGALIAAADEIDAGREVTLSQAFGMAWRKVWTLLGISILPGIPGLLLFLGGVGVAILSGGMASFIGLDLFAGMPNILIFLVGAVCVVVPLMMILNLLRTFANRACMLEEQGVFAAYTQGFSVLWSNLGSALILVLIQIGINLIMGVGLIVPTLCCVLWPLLLVVQGTAAAFFSTMWTLAWQEWTPPEALAAEMPR